MVDRKAEDSALLMAEQMVRREVVHWADNLVDKRDDLKE